MMSAAADPFLKGIETSGMLRFNPNFAIEQHLGCAAWNARLTSINTSFPLKTFVDSIDSLPSGQVDPFFSGDEVGSGSFLHYDGLDSGFTYISSCPILPSLPRASAA